MANILYLYRDEFKKDHHWTDICIAHHLPLNSTVIKIDYNMVDVEETMSDFENELIERACPNGVCED